MALGPLQLHLFSIVASYVGEECTIDDAKWEFQVVEWLMYRTQNYQKSSCHFSRRNEILTLKFTYTTTPYNMQCLQL